MAIDHKYGRVTLEHGSIGEDEQVIVFRARDRLLPMLLEIYVILCQIAGSTERHIRLIKESAVKILAWQKAHPDELRTPNSETSQTWMN